MGIQRKFEIFIGSTKQDLIKVREEIIRAILEAGHIPSGMELWSAGIKPTKIAINDRLQNCDIHIVLLGARYGYKPLDSNCSITEWEFLHSETEKRPVIAFFLSDAEFERERKKILGSNDSKDKGEQENEQLLRNFRSKVMSSRLCREFQSTPNGIKDLKSSCINAINEVIDSLPQIKENGWIRARSPYAKALNEIQENWFLHRILEKLHEFNWLREGVARQKEEKDVLGKIFWRHMEGRIKRNDFKDIFFESGSTLAYITNQFETSVLNQNDGHKWRITTNNVVILQELLLYTDIEVEPLPSGRPANQFGGMYTPELLNIREPAPLQPRGLYDREKNAINHLISRFGKYREKHLFLMSASGWALDCNEPSFNGINAQTHPDMLFKRAVLQTGKPVVCFLTSDKIGSCFQPHKHYPIFGPDFNQDEILSVQPIAICLSYKSSQDLHEINKKDRIKKGHSLKYLHQLLQYLEQLGFENDYVHEYLEEEQISVRMVANPKFIDIFGRG